MMGRIKRMYVVYGRPLVALPEYDTCRETRNVEGQCYYSNIINNDIYVCETHIVGSF